MQIVEFLEKNGHRARVVSFEHLDDLREEIQSLQRGGSLENGFYREWMPPYVNARLPGGLRKPRSIFVVATPVPQFEVTFHWKGRALDFIVPPTYAAGAKVTRNVEDLLTERLKPNSFKVTRAVLPVKLLAVRSGLAMYGRNNITYVTGLGSFHRLTAFYSDYAIPEDNWLEKKALPKCTKCRACLNACPTGAISDDRFLLRAERCLTCMNERKSDRSFPPWVKPEWHNAIVGCMICQRICPYNKNVIDWIEDGGSFSEEETEYLLESRHSRRKLARVEKKLKRVGLDPNTFPRNLKVLLDQRN